MKTAIIVGCVVLFLATGAAHADKPKFRIWYCPHGPINTEVHWTAPEYRGGPETVSIKTGGAEVGHTRVRLTKRGAYLNGHRCPRDFVMECTARREAAGLSSEGCGE